MKKLRYYQATDRETGKVRIIAAYFKADMTEYLAGLHFDIGIAKTDAVVRLIAQGAELMELTERTGG